MFNDLWKNACASRKFKLKTKKTSAVKNILNGSLNSSRWREKRKKIFDTNFIRKKTTTATCSFACPVLKSSDKER
jgi:hypothetical protein